MNIQGNKYAIYRKEFASPLGPMLALASQKGICYLNFKDAPTVSQDFRSYNILFDSDLFSTATNAHLEQLDKQLKAYFEGQLATFDLAIDLVIGTTFQQSVWSELYKLPFGKTLSYEKLALKLDAPKAIRAIAKANGSNKILIVYPCHRIIGKDGSLTGYRAGLGRKQKLIAFEQYVMSNNKSSDFWSITQTLF